MTNMLKANKRAVIFLAGTIGFLLAASALSACQVDDWIKIDVPEGVASAIGSDERIPLSESEAAWADWEAWVERETRKLSIETNKGWETSGLIRSISEVGFSVGQDAASTLPGGAIIASGLAMLGGLFLKRPGDGKKERQQSEASYNAGLEKGQRLAAGVMEGLKALRDGQNPESPKEGS